MANESAEVTKLVDAMLAEVGNLRNAVGAVGRSGNPSRVLRVASSSASTNEKAFADYVCDGTADEVEINQALTSLRAAGGIVQLGIGTFNLAATIALQGGTATSLADNPTIGLEGAGVDVTILNPASGVHGVTLTSTPKPVVRNMRINVSGASNGIHCTAPTTGANDRRGMFMGRFQDLKIQGDYSTHTGWAVYLESPFRSTFERIQGLGIKNGLWLRSMFSGFNPGNLVFENCHMDLALPNGTAYFLDSADGGGFLNIATFIECDAIDTAATASTTSIGWRFKGSTNAYWTTRDMLVLRSNVEMFNTAVSLEHAANIEVNLNYVDTRAGGTVFSTSTDTVNCYLSAQYVYVTGNKTTTALFDRNTDLLKGNTLRASFARVESGSTLNMTKTAATVLSGLARDSDGTGVYPAEWQAAASPLMIHDEGTELFRGTRRINFVGAGVTASAVGPDVTVTIPSNILPLAQGAAVPGGTPASTLIPRLGLPSVLDLAVPGTIPALPLSGIRLFGKNLAGRPHLASIDQYGHDVTLQPHWARNKIGMFTAIGNVTGILATGFGAPGTAGTASGVNVAATSMVTRTRRVKYATSTTAGALAELRTGAAQFTSGTGAVLDGGGYTSTTRWVMSNAAAVSGERFFCGMTASTTAAATNVEPNTLVNTIGVAQLSTDATQWYLVYGGTTAQTAIALGTALGRPDGLSAAVWELVIDAHPGRNQVHLVTLTNLTTGVSVTTTISGTAVQVPGSTALVGWKMYKTNNATALASAFDFIQHYIETDN